jgi:hypothetical protein
MQGPVSTTACEREMTNQHHTLTPYLQGGFEQSHSTEKEQESKPGVLVGVRHPCSLTILSLKGRSGNCDLVAAVVGATLRPQDATAPPPADTSLTPGDLCLYSASCCCCWARLMPCACEYVHARVLIAYVCAA